LLLERAFDDVRINATARPAWLSISAAIAWDLMTDAPSEEG
jgi:hypothetical protein